MLDAVAADPDKVSALEEENARLREQLRKNKKLQAQLLKTCAAEEAAAPQPFVVGTTAADTPATASDIEAGAGGGGGGLHVIG